jgi:site-specific recombinase XerD
MSASTYSTAERWADLLAAFEPAQRAKRIADSTIENRVKHVRRMAAWAVGRDLAPNRITYEDYRLYLDQTYGDSSRNRIAAVRTSLRAFFRWALAAARIDRDPTDEPSYTTGRADVPQAWAIELRAFRAYLLSLGRPATTIGVQLSQLSRFARDNASLAPVEVTFSDIVEWLSVKQWAPETRRAHRGILRTFYGYMNASGRMQHDPTTALPVIRRGTHLPRPALEEEYRDALAAADELEHIALRLAAELGLRRHEVAKVHTRDVMRTPDGDVLRVIGKGAKTRDLPLTESLSRMLRACPAGYVLPGQVNGHISAGYIGKRISALLPPGTTMHALRHRFASRVYAVDHDLLSLQELLGHASPTTTRVYVSTDTASRRRLVEAIAS